MTARAKAMAVPIIAGSHREKRRAARLDESSSSLNESQEMYLHETIDSTTYKYSPLVNTSTDLPTVGLDRYSPVIAHMQSLIKEKHWRRSENRAFRRRNLLILLNVVISLVLLVTVFEIEWNATLGKRVAHPATPYIKIIITILSVVQIFQTIEYYNHLLGKKAHLFTAPGSSPNATDKWIIWRRPGLQWRFWIEIAIILPHPIPYVKYDEYGLLMFLRLYVALKVARDYSNIYKYRKRISQLAGYPPSIEPSFNAALSLKTFYYDHPIIFCATWTLVQSLIFGWAIYVFEREGQPIFNFQNSFFLSISMMLLGWPADVRGELVPGTYTGTVLSYVLATVGISVFTLLLNYVINDLLVPSSLQKAAVDWNKFTKLKDAQRTAAAELIQLVWRRYRKKKRGYKFSKTKEEKYKIDLKAALRINKTMRWKAEKVEQSAKDHHQFSHHHHKDKKEKKDT